MILDFACAILSVLVSIMEFATSGSSEAALLSIARLRRMAWVVHLF